MKKAISFIKKETVLCVALLLAFISVFLVHPDKGYIDYIDFRTLAILFCLMAVMAGLKEIGVFHRLASGLIRHTHSLMGITITLNLLCFFLSMVITNDVALLTLVPFSFIIISMTDTKKGFAATLIIMLTIAANMGSMLTPLGNPQNLYLYGKSGLSFAEFLKTMLPYTGAAFIMLLLWIAVYCRKRTPVKITFETGTTIDKRKMLVYIILFVVSLLAVLKVYPYWIALIAVVLLMAVFDIRNFARVDYSLLLTFIGFFIFIGNMGRLPAFRDFLEKIVNRNLTATGIISSQVISNVPASLLLSGFTDRYKPLLIAVNLGGLGTLIASMASLISYKIYARECPDTKGRYLLYFTLSNVCFLAILIALNIIIKQ